jgi:surface antigen
MKKKFVSLMLAIGMASCNTPPGGYYGGGPYYGAPPPPRNAPYDRSYSYRDDVFYNQCRNTVDPAGVIAGALIGGLLGNAIGRSNNRGYRGYYGRNNATGATIAGVVLGGAAGALLTRNLTCEDQSYAYRSYYGGLNARRPYSHYPWQNPRTGNRGDFYVEDYYRGPRGGECANFSQTIWINGRPEEARGVACRQPDGTWAIVR